MWLYFVLFKTAFVIRHHPEQPQRIFKIFSKHQKLGLVDRCKRIPVRLATEEELAMCHRYGYTAVFSSTLFSRQSAWLRVSGLHLHLGQFSLVPGNSLASQLLLMNASNDSHSRVSFISEKLFVAKKKSISVLINVIVVSRSGRSGNIFWKNCLLSKLGA